jgi:predicted TIM-barrel fold metal-dependent hydrolase
MEDISSAKMTIGSFEIQGSKIGGLYDFCIVVDHQGKLELSTKVNNKYKCHIRTFVIDFVFY